MKKSLPCLSALAAVIIAVVATAESPLALPDNSSQIPINPPNDSQSSQDAVGDRLLMQAMGQLERHASVTARFGYQTAIGGQQLSGVLNYWQQGNGEDVKVRLELQLVGQDAQLLQVCNNRFVWIDRTLPTGRTIARVDLRKLRADPSLVSGSLNDIKPGEANWSSLQPELINYTGGFPTLLTALSENFAFLPPQAIQFTIASGSGAEPVKVPVFGVVGHWKSEKLAALVAKAPAKSADGQQPPIEPKHHPSKPIPERLPEEVLLLVRQAELFPYRIEYRRLETPEVRGSDGTAIPYQLSGHPMVVLQLLDVVFDAPIDAGQFDFDAGKVPFDDQTTAILERLRQQHQAKVATRPQQDAATPSRQ